VGKQLERVVLQALEKEPARRLGDAASFAAALRGSAASEHTMESTAIQPLALPAPENKSSSVPREPASPTASRQIVLRRSGRKRYVQGGLLAILLLGIQNLAALPLWSGRLPTYPSAPYALLPVLLAGAVLLSWIKARSWKCTMDANAAVVQWGIISHHRFGLPVRTVTTVELKQSPIDRMLGVGTVELCARDGHGAERRLIMEDLPHPREAYEELMQLLSRTSRTRPGAALEHRA
jgi:membrane protein YdbS with pleckstrin-like domain